MQCGLCKRLLTSRREMRAFSFIFRLVCVRVCVFVCPLFEYRQSAVEREERGFVLKERLQTHISHRHTHARSQLMCLTCISVKNINNSNYLCVLHTSEL